MSKKPPHHREPWTAESDQRLKLLAAVNTPTDAIAAKLGRTEAAVRAHASELDVSLKPTDKRRK